jgi:radical SAM superfamily enzyme YgiQ (UPF0313 family)
VVEEITMLVDRFNINFVWFADEDLFADVERLYLICEKLRENRINIHWRSFAGVLDIIKNEDLLREMRDVGYVAALVGIESCSDETLSKIGKGTSQEEIALAFEILDRLGISARGTYMLGYPWEDEASLVQGLERLDELLLDEVYLPFLTPFPGTILYDQCRREGLLLTEDFDMYDCASPVIRTSIGVERLKEIHREYLDRFYKRPDYRDRIRRKVFNNMALARAYDEVFESIFGDGGVIP